MQRLMLAMLVLALALGHCAPAAATYQIHPLHVDPVDATRRAIANGMQQVRDNDANATATIADAIHSEGFRHLPPDERFRALAIGAASADDHGDYAKAFAWTKQACVLPTASTNSQVWHLRLSAAYGLKDYADSAHSITVIARNWPRTLDQINAFAVNKVARQLADDAALKNDQFELLDSLFNAEWLSDGEQPSWRWLDLARLFLNRGNPTSAAAVVARIDFPSALVALRVNKQFDAIPRTAPSAFDIKTAAAKYVASAEARAENNPKRLQPIVLLQYAYNETLQSERALRVADEVVAKIGDRDGKTVYDDFGDQFVWILNNRASALWQLGRWEEAVEQERRAARRPENGELNVSQALNLATYYASLGQVEKALDAVSDLGSLSPYGRMQLEAIRVISAIHSSDQHGLDVHIEYMRSHRTDALATYQTALLDANRLDAASDLLLERLHNAAWRDDVLIGMQNYAESPVTPIIATRNVRWRAIIARPSVQAELSKVGRVEQVPLTSPLL